MSKQPARQRLIKFRTTIINGICFGLVRLERDETLEEFEKCLPEIAKQRGQVMKMATPTQAGIYFKPKTALGAFYVCIASTTGQNALYWSASTTPTPLPGGKTERWSEKYKVLVVVEGEALSPRQRKKLARQTSAEKLAVAA